MYLQPRKNVVLINSESLTENVYQVTSDTLRWILLILLNLAIDQIMDKIIT